MTSFNGQQRPHLALLPSAGMGHLAPFCRLAAALSARGCRLSFITSHPTVSSVEALQISHLLNSFPASESLNLPLVHLDPSEFPPSSDPFFLRLEAIRRSAHLLPPLLAAPISALVVNIASASTFIPVARDLNLPCYILFTSSASICMLSLCAHFPTSIDGTRSTDHPGCIGDIDVPGLWMIPKTSLPPALHGPNHLFTLQFIDNGRMLQESAGILINTFRALEPEALAALNGGRVVPNVPTVFEVGPLRPMRRLDHHQIASSPMAWLDKQPEKSVVYVCFGSRTAMTAEQIKEVGIGLERSGWRFLWVIKTKKVDREDQLGEAEEMLGEGYIERVKGGGMVMSGWAEQDVILSHRAVGGFVSHCGWNSVTEAAMDGVRVLGWPRGGDQRVNGEVVRRSGVGVWMEEWSWEADGREVRGEEIGMRAKEMMEDQELMRSAERVGEEARRATSVGGSSDTRLVEYIARLKVL